jgi:8-oxo-dGTP pyrophosphatase MutT (NUDIX family)
MGWNPEVTVAAVVERERRFLMVEEKIAGRLVFNQPAGHLEDRETLLEAVIRETREETAWRLIPEALVGIYLWRNPDNGRSFLRFAFCGGVDDHQPSQPLRSPLVLRCLDDYLLGRRQPLDSVSTLGMEAALQVGAVVNL